MENAGTENSGPGNGEQLSRDRLFELLSDQRRRYVVSYLQEEGAPVALADLAGPIAEWESAESPTATPDRQNAVHRSLYHRHVPKLADADVVAHDRDRGTVEPGDNFECAVALYDSFPAMDSPNAE